MTGIVFRNTQSVSLWNKPVLQSIQFMLVSELRESVRKLGEVREINTVVAVEVGLRYGLTACPKPTVCEAAKVLSKTVEPRSWSCRRDSDSAGKLCWEHQTLIIISFIVKVSGMISTVTRTINYYLSYRIWSFHGDVSLDRSCVGAQCIYLQFI